MAQQYRWIPLPPRIEDVSKYPMKQANAESVPAV
jgi:hypothetical protein